MARIYLSPPHLGTEERRLLLEALDSNWIAPLGPQVDAFEAEFAAVVGVPNAVALSSGTAALHVALIALGVGTDDDVLVSDLTFAATANAVKYVGAHPVFVDSDRASWNMDPDLLIDELRLRARTGALPAAVIAVDLYGQCADWHRIEAACAEYAIPVIEDAAEALGATYRDRPAGSFGTAAVFSFNGNKIITTSGGGMLVAGAPGLADRARFLSTQARDPTSHYEHSEVGYNYRLSNLLAAVGRGQLRSLADRVQRRTEINVRYRAALGSTPGLEFAPVAAYGRPTHWLTCVTVDPLAFGGTAADVIARLEERDIEARPTWKPMHLQPVFKDCDAIGGAVSADVFARGLCLPSGSSLTDAEVEMIAEIVVDASRG